MTWLLLSWMTARADSIVKHIAPGVTLTQEIDKKTPLVIDVLNVDLDSPGIHLGVGIGQDQVSGMDPTHGREDVSRYARRHHIVAAVNADFFPYTGDPLGIGIQDGRLFSEPWTGRSGDTPRVALGLAPDGHRVVFDTLGLLGDLQAQDGQRAQINGIDRTANANEIVVYTPLYGSSCSARAGSSEVIVQHADLPVRANKLIVGQVQQVLIGAQSPAAIPSDGIVLVGAPGSGADFLAQNVHAGDRIGFVMAVAPIGSVRGGIQVASLPRTKSDLPSRGGSQIDRQAYFWAQVPEAVGGGPRLLVDGQVAIDGVAEGFDAGFTDHANPRTAVGTSRDGRHLILVTVDGRQSISKGVTLTDLALILKRYGVWNAMNLDGGGSTCMAVGGLIVDSPSGTGEERPVADMLLVSSDTPSLKMPDDWVDDPSASVHLILPSQPVLVGSAMPLRVSTGSRTVSGSDPAILWQGMVSGGVGFVNQNGYFIPLKAGTGTVTALYQGQLLTGDVIVQSTVPAGSSYTIHADFSAAPSGASNRSQLTVRVLDQDGKPLSGASVQLSGSGGVPDNASLQTNADGYVTVGVTWAAAHGGSIRIQSGSLAPITALQPNG